MIAFVAIWTLAGLGIGIALALIDDPEPVENPAALITASTFVGFVIGWILALVIGFADLAVRIGS